MSHVDIVVGGQFGSEAKGHVCAVLARRQSHRSINIRVGGPNAGHTVIQDGVAFPFRHLPVAAVIGTGPLYLAPGSEVDIDVLASEMELCERHGHSVDGRVWVSSQATILEPHHRLAEEASGIQGRIGSTAKGIGAARVSRLERTAATASDSPHLERLRGLGVKVFPYQTSGLPDGRHLIEGTQGYGLGLHAGFYPTCTAGDCRNVDFLAQSGLPLNIRQTTWVVFRTFPIRVAGNSGPLKDEVTWEFLLELSQGYIQPERTTVTKKVRRIGMWDDQLAIEALEANGGPHDTVQPVLTFVDYLDPALAGSVSWDKLRSSQLAWPWVERTEERLGSEFALFTTGPDTHIWRRD